MKKFAALILTGIITAVSCVNCFAFISVDNCLLPEEAAAAGYPNLAYASYPEYSKIAQRYNLWNYYACHPEFIITDEYKMVDGRAMVKLRDIADFLGGRIEYNSAEKSTMIYFPLRNNMTDMSLAV